MKNKLHKIILTAVVLMSLVVSAFAEEKLGLLIIAHGSPSPVWMKQVNELKEQIIAGVKEKGLNYAAIEVCFLEASPFPADAFETFEAEGVDSVFVVPLFFVPSGHLNYDVPTVLGTYYDAEMYEAIKEEGITVVDTDIPITIGAPMCYGTMLEEIMFDRVKELSADPANEAVVILAHGDEEFSPLWENMLDEISVYIAANSGHTYVDHAFVEVGQSFLSDGLMAISKAAGERDKVIVVGLYLSMGVDNMAENVSFFSPCYNESKKNAD